MIFIDSNIPMYLIGSDHPHKIDSQLILEKLILEENKLVTSVEVFQEIMHRYVAIHKKEAIQIAFDCLYGIIDEVLPLTETDVLKAKDLLNSYKSISARDAMHAAIMKRFNISDILSFDAGFDQIGFINRIHQT